MKAVFIKGKILGNGKSNYICLRCDLPKNICQRVHLHFATTAAIPTKFRIRKIGRVEESLVEYINIKMDEDMIKAFYKFGDFLGADKTICLNFIEDSLLVQKFFLIIMKLPASQYKEFRLTQIFGFPSTLSGSYPRRQGVSLTPLRVRLDNRL